MNKGGRTLELAKPLVAHECVRGGHNAIKSVTFSHDQSSLPCVNAGDCLIYCPGLRFKFFPALDIEVIVRAWLFVGWLPMKYSDNKRNMYVFACADSLSPGVRIL